MNILLKRLISLTIMSVVLPVSATTVRENDLIMTMQSGIASASYDFNTSSFQVSSGQPSGQPPVVSSFTPSNSQLNIRVFAGRKKSKSVAKTFNSRTTERVATRRNKASGGPNELNFTFSGILTLNTDQFPNFNIGQGNKGVNNNWWVGTPSGGKTAKKGGNAFLCLTGATGTLYQIKLPGNDSFHLKVKILNTGASCGS